MRKIKLDENATVTNHDYERELSSMIMKLQTQGNTKVDVPSPKLLSKRAAGWASQSR